VKGCTEVIGIPAEPELATKLIKPFVPLYEFYFTINNLKFDFIKI
jgi:hypothetical protein